MLHSRLTFSIITVTYNAEQTLERTLRSVAMQTYPHIEHILIDGESKDRTMEIAQAHGKHLSKTVSEPDRGLYDAMNKGLRLATGDYVCFLNAGDKLHAPDTLEQIAETIESADTAERGKRNVNTADYLKDKTNTTEVSKTEKQETRSAIQASERNTLPGVLYGHTDIVDNEGKFLHTRRLKPHDGLSWKSFKQGMLVCHQAFYARRDLCPEYDTSFRFSADFDWCIRVMKQSNNLLHLPFPVADYLEEGMTTRNHRASLIERFRLMCRHYGAASTIVRHLWFAVRNVIK